MGRNTVIPEFRVSEISGTQCLQEQVPASLGSRLFAHSRYGRDARIGAPP
jgi:hypothetical protein